MLAAHGAACHRCQHSGRHSRLAQVAPHAVGLPRDGLDVQPLKHGGGRSSDSGLLIMANRQPTDSGFEPYEAWCGSELFANKGVRRGKPAARPRSTIGEQIAQMMPTAS